MYDVIQSIQSLFDDKLEITGIVADLSKPFDQVDHNICCENFIIILLLLKYNLHKWKQNKSVHLFVQYAENKLRSVRGVYFGSAPSHSIYKRPPQPTEIRLIYWWSAFLFNLKVDVALERLKVCFKSNKLTLNLKNTNIVKFSTIREISFWWTMLNFWG